MSPRTEKSRGKCYYSDNFNSLPRFQVTRPVMETAGRLQTIYIYRDHLSSASRLVSHYIKVSTASGAKTLVCRRAVYLSYFAVVSNNVQKGPFLQECSQRSECDIFVYKHSRKQCFLPNGCNWDRPGSGSFTAVSYRKLWP